MLKKYRRTLPRDLFNEASLLKCYGRLWILIEGRDKQVRFDQETVARFRIQQDDASGDLTIINLTFRVRGVPYRLMRPLNSREAWPLLVEHMDPEADFDSIQVFDDKGNFTPEMLAFLEGTQ
jgi:hypothetical protein